MDFTREPIIECVITPKEGSKIVVRSSKGTGQEEFFVDAVEIVSFGNSFFFRSVEKPKPFLVPVSDYEVLEVREPRMVLKNVGFDRTIKIAGGRETKEKEDESKSKATEPRGEKKRERRRAPRKRKPREETKEPETQQEESKAPSADAKKVELPPPQEIKGEKGKSAESVQTTPSVLTSLLPPPTSLISEQIDAYRGDSQFKGVFVEGEELEPQETVPNVTLEEPTFAEREQLEETPVAPSQETVPEGVEEPANENTADSIPNS